MHSSHQERKPASHRLEGQESQVFSLWEWAPSLSTHTQLFGPRGGQSRALLCSSQGLPPTASMAQPGEVRRPRVCPADMDHSPNTSEGFSSSSKCPPRVVS